ncbi:MAG: response regulator transcription factor [Prevotella sp.]|nr:response regulator transcription factor [Prevotella sp.]
MDKKKILVVDDERDLCDILKYNLTTAGFETDTVYFARDVLKKNLSQYHLLLLDVMLPDMSGFELAKRIKAEQRMSYIPIIFLTAKDAEEDTLTGFDIGADDYITKPFSIREVIARVKAVLHRVSTSHTNMADSISYKGLTMNLKQKSVTIDGEEVSLTKTEFGLLYLLMSNPGQVFSRQQLLEKVWPQDVIVTDRTVDVNMARMRKKLKHFGPCIVARQGFGYLFE